MLGPDAPRRIRIAVDVLALLTALSLFFTGFVLYGRFTETNRLRQDNRHVWHSVICTIEAQIVSDKRTTYAQKVQSLYFWDNLLVNSVGALPCRLPLLKG